MRKARKAVPQEAGGREPEPVLRAKYLDYCSSRVAEALLALTADEMYLLAQEAARESDRSGQESLGYEEIVRLATERVSRGLSLPPFDTWVEAYREDPSHFESEMLGLWERDAEESPDV